MKEFSRLLFTRGIHRYFGNPALGTVSGFLSFIFILRSTVNLYLIHSISAGDAVMDYIQIIQGWFIMLAAYIITCSSLSAYHISFALPKNCFASLAPEGRRFRSVFLKQAFLIRPMNLTIMILTIIGEFIFFSTSPVFYPIFMGTGILLAAVAAASLIFKLASQLSIEMADSQLLKTVFLTALVFVNPDVININGRVQLLFNGLFIPTGNPLTAISALLAVPLSSVLLLVLIKLFSSISFSSRKKSGVSPLLSWYWRFLKPRYWISLYLVYYLIQGIPGFSAGIRVQTGIIVTTAAVLSFLFFLNSCDNRLRESLRVSILQKNNRKFLIQPVMLHMLMISILPVINIFSRILRMY